jgi:hypothetical protein
MRRYSLNIACIAAAFALLTVVMGWRSAVHAAAPAAQPAPSKTSPGQAAIEKAAAANKYLFIFLWKEKNTQSDKAWSVLQPAAAKMASQADIVAIQITNPAESQIVKRFDVSRDPMPLVLAIAPCGAVTKAFLGAFDENQLRSAFVSPCTQFCMKALQENKLVLLCVSNQTTLQTQSPVPQGVKDFKTDQRYYKATEVIMVNAADMGEAELLKEMKIDPKAQKPVVVFLAPPGSLIGRYEATITKDQLVSQLASAQSGSCPEGQCGPNGCPPKK